MLVYKKYVLKEIKHSLIKNYDHYFLHEKIGYLAFLINLEHLILLHANKIDTLSNIFIKVMVL